MVKWYKTIFYGLTKTRFFVYSRNMYRVCTIDFKIHFIASPCTVRRWFCLWCLVLYTASHKWQGRLKLRCIASMCFLRSPRWLACLPQPPHSHCVEPLLTDSSSTCLSISNSEEKQFVKYRQGKCLFHDIAGKHFLADLCTSRAVLVFKILPHVSQV